MVDNETMEWAQAQPAYRVTRMRQADGSIAPHYLRELEAHGLSFDQLMEDPMFARIIGCELEAEAIADASLAPLAEYAPSKRVRDLFLRWLAFENADLDPWTTGGAIHFRPHWSRVLMHALALGEARGLNDFDMEAIAMAAVFHDSRRKDPYLDTGHGARAATYYLQFCRETSKVGERLTPAGRAMRFDPRTYLAIRWHDRDDDDGLAAIELAVASDSLPEAGIREPFASVPSGCVSAKEVMVILKDADALDRVRLGGMDHGGLDVSYLRTPESHELLPFARTLLEAIRPAEPQTP